MRTWIPREADLLTWLQDFALKLNVSNPAGQPEVQRYRVRFLEGDDPVGNRSAVVSVIPVP